MHPGLRTSSAGLVVAAMLVLGSLSRQQGNFERHDGKVRKAPSIIWRFILNIRMYIWCRVAVSMAPLQPPPHGMVPVPGSKLGPAGLR